MNIEVCYTDQELTGGTSNLLDGQYIRLRY